MTYRLPIHSFILTLFCIVAIDTAVARPPSHGIAYFGSLKYSEGFPHFDYANPEAPRGGRVRAPELGTFNNLNPFVSKGVRAAGIGYYSGISTWFPGATRGEGSLSIGTASALPHRRR